MVHMQTDPYWCSVCDVTFTNEKASYEHDISFYHHMRYEEVQKACGGPIQHFCSVCDVGCIVSLKHWSQHCSGRRHRAKLKEFHDFYSKRFVAKRPAEGPQPVHTAKKRLSKPPNTSYVSSSKRVAQSHSKVSQVPSSTTSSSSALCSKTEESSAPVLINITAGEASEDVSAVKAAAISSSSSSLWESSPTQSGLMLNALEAVNPDSSTTVPVTAVGNKEPITPKTHASKTRRSADGTRKPHDPRKWSGQRRATTTNASLTAHSYDTILPSNSPLVTPTASTNSTVQPSSAAELQSMQEALDISRQLDALSTRQHVIETKISQLQEELTDLKSRKRTLKLRRTSILRGLAHSESDDEALDNRMPPNPDSVSMLTTSSEKQIASVAPVACIGRANGSMDSFATPLSSSAALDVSDIRSVNSLLPLPNLSIPPPPLPPLLTHGFGGDVAPLVSVGSKPVPMAPSSMPVLAGVPQSIAQTFFPATSDVPSQPPNSGLDFQRLSLIRQALQSPDCWQFTFEDVDQMLMRTAARAAAAAAACSVSSQSSIPGTAPSFSSASVGKSVTTSSSLHSHPLPASPRTLVKCEPTVTDTNDSGAPLHYTSSGTLSCQVSSKHTSSNHSSNPKGSPSSASSDEEPHVPLTSKVARVIKHDPSLPISGTTDLKGTINLSPATRKFHPDDSDVNSSHSITTKEHIKYGEFHAFDGGPAAVIDMALHNTSYSVIIGGQNGSLRQYSLKSHQLVRCFPSRDASVTRLILELQCRTLYVGYYDNYFAEFDTQSGAMTFQKTLPNRVEALTLLPSQDSPFVYMGMSNGDILRHHVSNRTTSVLYQNSKVPTCGISSMASVRSGSRLILLIGERDFSLTLRSATDGSLIRCITSSPHKGPPEGITALPSGSNFCSYSEKSLRVHNWISGVGVLTVQTQKITSCCVMERFVAIGDSEGSIRVYKMLTNGLPAARPVKVYYASTQAAITSMISCGVALVCGGLDGTVTVIWVSEPATNYTCLYGPFGHTCGIGFGNRKDLITHVMDTHLVFGNQKSVVCRWGGGRCRTRFTDTKSIKAISDHLLTHIPD